MSSFAAAEWGTLEQEWRERVRFYINRITEHQFDSASVDAVLEDALSLSGKLIRPKLLLQCGMLGPKWQTKTERLYLLAAMVELVHAASLIHDDIIDNAPYRRGKPSVQSKYGKKAAVYAGDFIIARIHYHAALNQLNETAAILSKTIEAMCSGEIGQAACSYKEDVTIEEYFFNIQGKTGALFKAACTIGAAETGCSDATVNALATFGENFGCIFQLKDDILDFTSSQTVQGKKVHKDFRSGVYTFPVLMAMQHPEGCNAILPFMRDNAKRRLTNKEIADMEAAVVRCGGIKAAYEKVQYLVGINRKLIAGLGQSGEVNSAMLAGLEKLLNKLEAA
ncbi:MAG: polyprenyl synthetase family protein [Treponema sp.]